MSITGSLHDPLKKATRYLPQYMRLFTDRVSRDMTDAIKKRTHVDTGELKESIVKIDTDRHRTTTGIDIWVGGTRTELKRASYSEYDTAPHIIRAKTPAGLRFFSRKHGTTVRREFVNHPGTTGVHMFARGADLVQAQIPLRGTAMINRWARRYGL